MKKRKEKQKDMQKESLRDKIATSFEASKEVILDAAKLVFVGNCELTVENYKSIAEYTENQIILETNPHRLKIQGAQLEIKTIARDFLYITGRVLAVEFKMEG